MDFLEKIGYTDARKRLRKRFYHYSQRVIESQPFWVEAFQFSFCELPGVIFEHKS